MSVFVVFLSSVLLTGHTVLCFYDVALPRPPGGVTIASGNVPKFVEQNRENQRKNSDFENKVANLQE